MEKKSLAFLLLIVASIIACIFLPHALDMPHYKVEQGVMIAVLPLLLIFLYWIW